MEQEQKIYISPLKLSKEEILKILPTIPRSPGCYQYFDEEGTLIYVGKAKDLRKRISSYFQRDITDRKTRMLVKNIRGLKYTIVDTEADALILENSLIKTFQPKYNVLLKDGKTYPSIVIKKECFPRIFMTRDIRKDGSEYFGPYPSVTMAKTVANLIKDMFKIRTCRLDLSPERISNGNYRECLKWHINRCDAPCTGRISKEKYEKNISEAKEILKGNLSPILRTYKEEMMQASEELRFEDAQVYKEKINLLEQYEAKHTVSPRSIKLIDVFSFDEDTDWAYINYMQVSEGMVRLTLTVEYKKVIEEEKEEILSRAISELRERFESKASEIILPFDPEWNTEDYKITIPVRGDKKKLLDLSIKNVEQYKKDKHQQSEKLNSEQARVKLMQEMKRDLHMDREPKLMHCFDNSNIQGTNPVAACTVFRNGKPSKKDYKLFHVKTVIGADDYSTMREIIRRRYELAKREEEELPDLIVIDGGKGQLRAAYETLEDMGLIGKLTLIGLAERVEEIFYPHDPIPQTLPFNGSTLRTIRWIRDEAHRFGITFHRKTRSKSQVKSELDDIPGIGPKSKTELIKHFRSVKRIKEASFEEIAKIIGENRAQKLHDGLSKS